MRRADEYILQKRTLKRTNDIVRKEGINTDNVEAWVWVWRDVGGHIIMMRRCRYALPCKRSPKSCLNGMLAHLRTSFPQPAWKGSQRAASVNQLVHDDHIPTLHLCDVSHEFVRRNVHRSGATTPKSNPQSVGGTGSKRNGGGGGGGMNAPSKTMKSTIRKRPPPCEQREVQTATCFFLFLTNIRKCLVVDIAFAWTFLLTSSTLITQEEDMSELRGFD